MLDLRKGKHILLMQNLSLIYHQSAMMIVKMILMHYLRSVISRRIYIERQSQVNGLQILAYCHIYLTNLYYSGTLNKSISEYLTLVEELCIVITKGQWMWYARMARK
jgi:hypothetical protein